jgi:hypothetical protein
MQKIYLIINKKTLEVVRKEKVQIILIIMMILTLIINFNKFI